MSTGPHRPSDPAHRIRSRGTRGTRRAEILTVSLTMFNEQGVASVTTNHICERMGISPGNLYYYFGSREDIVLALFSRLEEVAPISLGPLREPVTPEEWARPFIVGINAVWENRYLFSNLTDLTSRDPRLRRRVHDLALWIIDAVLKMLKTLMQAGVMRPPERHDDLKQLANAWYILYWNWPAFIRLTRGSKAVRGADIAEGALHGHLLFEPHLDPEFAAQTRTIIEAEIAKRAGRPEATGSQTSDLN
jgi:AcrR family transcriptional regulator